MRYYNYKLSGIEWLKELPNHWTNFRFKDFTKVIQDGTHFTPTYTNNGINFLSVNDITRSVFDLSKSKYITFEAHKELIKRCKPIKGDILLSKNGTIGVPFLIDFDTEVSIYVSLCLIRLKKGFNNRYFYYILLSDFMFDQYKINAKTNSVSNLHLDKLANFYSIFPPFEEQTAIAQYLDTKTQAIDKKINLLTKKADYFKELRKSIIHHGVCRGLDKNVKLKESGIEWIGKVPEHWNVERLKAFAKTVKGRNLEFFDEPFEKSLPILSLDYLRNDKVEFINYCYTKDKSQLVDENDFIIIWDGAGIGEILKGKKGFISSTTAKFIFNKKMYSKFFFHLRDFIEYTLKQIPTGMGIPHLNPQVLNNFPCPVPPKEEQTAIANYLDDKTQKIDAIVSNIGKQIEALKELRKTLINDVVTGKIKVANN